MSGIRPIFISAPRIRLVIDGAPVAYAIGMNLDVSVDVQPVYAFGGYQSVNVEPLMYGVVTGTIQIIKLVSKTELNKRLEKLKKTATSTSPQDATTAQYLKARGAAADSGSANSVLGKSGLGIHLNPERVLLSRTFDMEIKMFHAVAGATSSDPSTVADDAALYTIKDCRITSSNINISMGQLVNEPVSFQGLILIDKEKGDKAQEQQDTQNKDGVQG
jgi:hypothetical protein